MTPFVIDKKSWHYRLVAKYNSSHLWHCVDLCTYARVVLVTLLAMSLFATMTIGFIGLVFGDTIAWIVACLVTGEFLPLGVGVGTLVVGIGVLVALAVWFAISEWYDDRRYNNPSAIMLAYRSWKDKYCAKIVFEDMQPK